MWLKHFVSGGVDRDENGKKSNNILKLIMILKFDIMIANLDFCRSKYFPILAVIVLFVPAPLSTYFYCYC